MVYATETDNTAAFLVLTFMVIMAGAGAYEVIRWLLTSKKANPYLQK